MEELGYGGPLRQVSYENTYISEPEGYGPGTKFERHRVHEVLETELKSRLKGKDYDPVKSSQISKMLADELREKVSLPLQSTQWQPVHHFALLSDWHIRCAS